MSLLDPIRVVIDGNEANVANRVGSNIYAFEILKALEELTRTKRKEFVVKIILAQPPVADWPTPRAGWSYEVVKPTKFWTQWAEPIYLAKNQRQFEVFYTPGHYAPRICRLPMITSVMDLAYLEYPDQFQPRDLAQLTDWTAYSVKNASKVVAISKFTRQELVAKYHLPKEKIIVAPPGINRSPAAQIVATYDQAIIDRQLKKVGLKPTDQFFLYVGTIQPRKNLVNLITAFTTFITNLQQQKDANWSNYKFVLAGKIGWLADETLAAAKNSPVQSQIILPGFVTDEQKELLLKRCLANYNLGLYEGFGIPALEALAAGSLPVVANNTSLPEVVGQAGLAVDPFDLTKITATFSQVLKLTPTKRAKHQTAAAKQLAKFSYEKSALTILTEIRKLAAR